MTIVCEGVVTAAAHIGLAVRFLALEAGPENATTVLEWNVTAPGDLSEIKKLEFGNGSGRRIDLIDEVWG